MNYLVYLIVISLIVASKSHESSTNNIVEILRPAQLVYPDREHQQLLINETTLSQLNSLVLAGERLSVIGVVGTFHSGKSFFLNQLLGTTDRFTVGPTVDPETKGIWVVANRIEYEGRKSTLLLLDTEGFYSSNVSETYDAKIFAITALLSSRLIYNSVKIIDQSELEYLELLSRRTQLFSLKSQLKSSEQQDAADKLTATELHDILKFPRLTWIVQDFFQDIGDLTATQWLGNLLHSRYRDSTENSLSISEIFPEIDCFTLFIPSGDKQTLRHLDRSSISDLNPSYLRELATVKDQIFSSLAPKLTGPAISSLLRLLIEVANGNKFPSVPSIWSGFLKQQQQSAHEDTIVAYRERMDQYKHENPPFTPAQLDALDRESSAFAHELYKQLLFDLQDAYTPGLGVLTRALKDLLATYQRENNDRIRLFCHSLYLSGLDAYSRGLEGLVLPLGSSHLIKSIEERQATAVQEYQDAASIYAKTDYYRANLNMLRNDMDRISSRRQVENKNEIEALLLKSVAEVTDGFKASLMEAKLPAPLGNLQLLYSALKQQAEDQFKEATRVAKGEVYYSTFIDSLDKGISKIWTSLKEQNERLVLEKSRMEADRCIYEFKKLSASLILPNDESFISQKMHAYQIQVIERYKSKLEEFSSSTSYRETLDYLHQILLKQIELKIRENVTQMKLIVEETLRRVKQLASSRYRDYFFRNSFLRFIRSECDSQLLTKISSNTLREKVIESFIENDLKFESSALWSYNPTNLLITLFIIIISLLLLIIFRK